MCTRALWRTTGGRVLVGRNMDWMEDQHTDLWALPAGVRREGLVDDGASWTARYGSLVATSYAMTGADGMNEAGLSASMLWLAEADYGPRHPDRPAIAVSLWAQYFLDQFATVAEAVASLEEAPLQPVGQIDPNTGLAVTVHLALGDPGGDSAVIEYVDGAMRVHHDPSYAVMTNSPPFEQQLEHLASFEGFGGTRPLPGTTEAADRFVRAAYYLHRLPDAGTPREAVAAVLSVMRNASQPFGTPDAERPNISATIWRTVADLTDRVYFFESVLRPNIVWVSLDRLDLRAGEPARVLRLADHGDELVGEVSGAFEPAEPFAFAAP